MNIYEMTYSLFHCDQMSFNNMFHFGNVGSIKVKDLSFDNSDKGFYS